jgi:hypothetical protein
MLAGIVCIVALGAPQLQAQQQLPGIVVMTPSPIKRPAQKAATGGSEQAPAAPEPGPEVPRQLQFEPDFAAVNVLTQPDLLAQPYGQLGDALATQPGIASTSRRAPAGRSSAASAGSASASLRTA